MTQYVKYDSDRPDLEFHLQTADGHPVDLSDASAVTMEISRDGTVESQASLGGQFTMPGPAVGHLRFDVQNIDEPGTDEFDTTGTNHVEFRVDWPDGDQQWFPVDRPSFEVEVVEPPHPRP